MPKVLRFAGLLIAAGLACGAAAADDNKPHTLSPQEAADGWLMLFDGETTFGWKIEGEAVVKDNALVLGGKKATVATCATRFGAYDLRAETVGVGKISFASDTGTNSLGLTNQPTRLDLAVRTGRGNTSESTLEVGADNVVVHSGSLTTSGPAALKFEVAAGYVLTIRSAKVKPHGAAPLFNGKDLTGWKVFEGDPKRARSKFEVTPAGELRVTDGPGDLQTEGKYADFVLQLECKTNGKHLNSGVFFRCVPDQYQNGYEAQIHNGYKDGDRTKPIDFGTGAIYRRVPARKVVSDDNEWFTMTVAANGPHVATWVNGYQTVDWTDDRKPADNPRQGLRTAAGHLSIQGHDPTTDILFRNIRIAEVKANGRR
jgi:hypothetical protein